MINDLIQQHKAWSTFLPCQENFPPDRVIVDTRQGPVVGRLEEDYDVRFRQTVHWSSFTGIPFAAPPVGHLRFQPPQVKRSDFSSNY